MFAEAFWRLPKADSRLGVILPTGIYSDFGTKDLREELLLRGRLDFLYAFQNEKKIFSAADHRYKQTALLATKGGHTESFQARFRMGVGDSPEAHEIPDDLLRNDSLAMRFTPDDVRKNSPKSLSLVELRSQRDLDIFRKIYDHSIRIGDNAPGWEITYATEFHMTNDSRLFPTLEQWEAKGYKPDVFGRWIGPEADVVLPLYQGGMIHLFDPCFKSWQVETAGRGEWRSNHSDHKRIASRYGMSGDTYRQKSDISSLPRIGYRGIARNTDTRTMICSYMPEFPCGNSVLLLYVRHWTIKRLVLFQSFASSIVFDYVLRQRMSGSNLNWYVIEECPIPCITQEVSVDPLERLAFASAQLTFLHRRFAAEWLKLRQLCPDLGSREWKHWWAVTETDRLRLRVEIDALCADLYGLDPDDFDWIVRDDPSDSKGFYRVDRQLPFRERLTGLSAAAFRALKEGKWSAENAASLSNDEFFEILGIPELTNVQAAHAKGLTGPRIAKRDGCHVWMPENFPEDDPRHGWTWDDCWNDAVALIGSEEAVQKYIEQKKEKPAEYKSPNNHNGPTDLFGNPLPPKQGKLF